MTQRRDSVLIVDDERFNINVLKDLLDPDYDIMVAKNGEQALKRALSSPPPDLILLDIMMPGMDGYQVLERLKNDQMTREIPVIFITAMSESSNEAKGLGMGAVDYITKPFSPLVVQARVKTQLKLKWMVERERILNRKLAGLNDELADKNAQLIELNKALKDMASIDGLTGVPNRRRFDEYLDQEWKRSLRDQTSLSLILIDIDYFKPYNDNYGHAAGDECLKKVALALSDAMQRGIDLLARFGGEEFVSILPETDSNGAAFMGNRLREAVESLYLSHEYSKVEQCITISLGSATIVPDQESKPEDLIRLADERLYKAKEAGRNRIVTE